MIPHSQKPKHISFINRATVSIHGHFHREPNVFEEANYPLSRSSYKDFNILEEDRINIYTNTFSPTWPISFRMSYLHIFFLLIKKT